MTKHVSRFRHITSDLIHLLARLWAALLSLAPLLPVGPTLWLPRLYLDRLVPMSQTVSSHAVYLSPWIWMQQTPLKRRVNICRTTPCNNPENINMNTPYSNRRIDRDKHMFVRDGINLTKREKKPDSRFPAVKSRISDALSSQIIWDTYNNDRNRVWSSLLPLIPHTEMEHTWKFKPCSL